MPRGECARNRAGGSRGFTQDRIEEAQRSNKRLVGTLLFMAAFTTTIPSALTKSSTTKPATPTTCDPLAQPPETCALIEGYLSAQSLPHSQLEIRTQHPVFWQVRVVNFAHDAAKLAAIVPRLRPGWALPTMQRR